MVIVVALGYIANKLLHDDNLYTLLSLVKKFSVLDYFIILVVFVLMGINWFLEAFKWQILVKKLEIISLKKAFGAVLAGLTASVFTPNRVGEYFGRVLVLKERHRVGGVVSTIVGSMSQLLITIVLGAFSLIIYINVEKLIDSNLLLLFTQFAIFLFVVVLIFLFFRVEKLKQILKKIKYFRKHKHKISVLKSYKSNLLLKVLGLSFLRYLVFTFQYFLLLEVFSVDLNYFQMMYSVSLVYFVSAIIPTFSLAEIGVKGGAAIFFLGIFSGNIVGIVSATLFLWIINVALPSVLGTFVLYKLKV